MIISIDLWAPGEISEYTGRNHLLNAMCDMTQFVVFIATEFVTASHLARLFMEGVLLKFGLCSMIIVDDDSKFKSTFVEMAACLRLRLHVAAARSHKTVGVERFHRFLNHSTTIFAEERGTSECFVECGMMAAYTWNASPIDETGIIRSIPAIGRELKFPLDIDLHKLSPPTSSAGESVATYLRHMKNDVAYSRQLLAWLLDDRRTLQRERENAKKHLITFKPNDVVMVRTVVHSNKSKGVVGKLVYQTRGPYVVVDKSSEITYNCKKYGKPGAIVKKFRTEDLYLLPPQILPCDSADTADLWYLHSDFAPLSHPFSKKFDIEAYNTRWFDSEPPLLKKSKIPPLPVIPFPSPAKQPLLLPVSDDALPNQSIPSASAPSSPSTSIRSQLAPDSDAPQDSQLMSAATLYAKVKQSTNKLFFISYTPADTLRPRRYLVQVDLKESPQAETSG